MNRIESASGATAIWGSALAILGQLFGWVSANATLCGLIIAFIGLMIQIVAASHTRRLREAEERRKQAEEQRHIEEHQIKMQILRGELPDRRLATNLN